MKAMGKTVNKVILAARASREHDDTMNRILRTLWLTFFLSATLLSRAQLCTGSLGDAVVNITFGTAASPDASFTPPAAYTYTGSSCPNDGFYTITTNTQNCFSGNWHSVLADHTGGGAFMLVNASYTPGDFFRTMVNDLCANTTYEFASWVMNVLKATGISPDLTFRIEKPDGTLLGQFSTGPISTSASPAWQQYGFYFTTPADNSSVVLRITNNAPGGIGNDLALDDITFRPCGPPVTASIQGVSGEIDDCEKDQVDYTFDADPSSFYTDPVFQWQLSTDSGANWMDISGATGNSFTRNRTTPGHYWYRFAVTERGASSRCRIYSNELVINVWPKPLVDAGPDRVVLLGDSVRIKARTDINSTYSWDPPQFLSDPTVLMPAASPPYETMYTLFVTSAFGCTDEDMVTVKVTDKIHVPTAFTPNNDGKNDTWRIPMVDPEWELTARVYDRYGQLIYQAKGANISWDGTCRGVLQTTGVYIYMVTVRSTGAILKGTIALIR